MDYKELVARARVLLTRGKVVIAELIKQGRGTMTEYEQLERSVICDPKDPCDLDGLCHNHEITGQLAVAIETLITERDAKYSEVFVDHLREEVRNLYAQLDAKDKRSDALEGAGRSLVAHVAGLEDLFETAEAKVKFRSLFFKMASVLADDAAEQQTQEK